MIASVTIEAVAKRGMMDRCKVRNRYQRFPCILWLLQHNLFWMQTPSFLHAKIESAESDGGPHCAVERSTWTNVLPIFD